MEEISSEILHLFTEFCYPTHPFAVPLSVFAGSTDKEYQNGHYWPSQRDKDTAFLEDYNLNSLESYIEFFVMLHHKFPKK